MPPVEVTVNMTSPYQQRWVFLLVCILHLLTDLACWRWHFSEVHAWIPSIQSTIMRPHATFVHELRLDAKHRLQEEDEIEDWRDFRAKLVMQYRNNSDDNVHHHDKSIESLTNETNPAGEVGTKTRPTTAAASSSSSWAYESGSIIETGSLIIAHPRQDFAYGGLNQQYFHKSIILVVEHDNFTFTKGLILNRPTNSTWFSSSFGNERQRLLQQQQQHQQHDDEEEEGGGLQHRGINRHHSCKVWFGGDVQGIHTDPSDKSETKELLCLHSLSSPMALEFSYPVMKNIQCTSFLSAQILISNGEAAPEDFWLFCGYSGWKPGQLQNELDRGNWLMVASDSQSIWNILYDEEKSNRQSRFGVQAWEIMMKRIGRRDLVGNESVGGSEQRFFEDEMLREWVRTKLSTHQPYRRDSLPPGKARAHSTTVWPGTVLCASSAEPSPFLLENQVLHQSLVLVLKDDVHSTVGVLLNRPMASTITLNLKDTTSVEGNSIFLRYGGRFGVKGQSQKPINFFHFRNRALREARVGAPVGKSSSVSRNNDDSGIWSCSKEDAETAIDMGLAGVDDFLAVEGVTIWTKQKLDGLWAEIEKGNFRIAPTDRLVASWKQLTRQCRLTRETLDDNLELARSVWILSSPTHGASNVVQSNSTHNDARRLADTALKLWFEFVQLKRLSNS